MPPPSAVALSADWYAAESPGKGRGLFAARAFAEGEAIGAFAGLPLSAAEIATLKPTRVYDYVFWVRDAPEAGPEAFDATLALGAISLCNHSRRSNARFEVDADGLYIRLFARRAIADGEEITIDYEGHARFIDAEDA